jgi:hypothetical protein
MPARGSSESDLEHASLLDPSIIQLRNFADVEKADDSHEFSTRSEPCLQSVPPLLQTFLSYLFIVLSFLWIVAECVDNDIAACALANPELPALVRTGCWWWLASAAFFLLYWLDRSHRAPLGIALFLMAVGWTVLVACLFMRLRRFGYVEGGWRMMAVA